MRQAVPAWQDALVSRSQAARVARCQAPPGQLRNAPRACAAESGEQGTLRISIAESLEEVSAAEWDGCAAGSKQAGGSETNPFVSHAFLLAMETSGSASTRTGWQPAHVLARDTSGKLLAAAPAYLKSHSMGEYVFDHSWASAYQRSGGRYYPKLISCSPFSPVTGPRLLVSADAPAGTAAALSRGIIAVADALQLSSAHITFPCQTDVAQLRDDGWLLRTGLQYHWQNRGYSSFADFEAALVQRRRKVVRQERKKAQEGLRLRRLRGADITAKHWDAFYDFYCDTADRQGGRVYLTRSFFDQMGAALGDSVMLVTAEEAEPGGGDIVAAALNLCGSDALFGRNWGCRGERPFLHMELCYYQAIEEAIERGLERVEAGAQGEHKMARGYDATPTYSAHYIRDRPFRDAVENFLMRETEQMGEVIAELRAGSPYKRDEGVNT